MQNLDLGDIIKNILDDNLRLVVYYTPIETQDTVSEYHFIKDLGDIRCVQCTSISDDPLKLCGSIKSLDEFLKIVGVSKYTPNYKDWYERVKLEVYPKHWYSCFETEVTEISPEILFHRQNLLSIPKVSQPPIRNTVTNEQIEKRKMMALAEHFQRSICKSP